MMVSPSQNMLTREELLKKLLHGASPRNPTYILGRILGDFKAQGSTELTVSQYIIPATTSQSMSTQTQLLIG